MRPVEHYRKKAETLRDQAASMTPGTIKRKFERAAEQYEAVIIELEKSGTASESQELQAAVERQSAHENDPAESIAALKPPLVPEPEKDA